MGRVSSAYLTLRGLAALVGLVGGSALGQRLGIVAVMDRAAVLVAASAGGALLLPGASITAARPPAE